VAQYCPERIDPQRYNWEEQGWAVKTYCPNYAKSKKNQELELE